MTPLEQSERALVGCLLEQPELVADVDAGWFDDRRIALLIETAKGMVQAGKALDAGTLVHSCPDKTLAGLVMDCQAQCHSAANFPYWRDIVAEHANKVRLEKAARTFISKLATANGDLPKCVAELEVELTRQPNKGDRRTLGPREIAVSLADHLEERFNLQGKRSGLETGFAWLDRMLDGLQFGEVTILGARPGTGKTAFACNIVEKVCLRDKVPTLFLTLEMSAAALSRRLLSSVAGIPMGALKSGNLSERDVPKIAEFDRLLKDSPLYMREGFGGMSASEAAALILRGAARKGVRLVVLDYLQKLRSDHKQEKRTYEIGETSGALVDAVRASRVALLCAAQLNRESEKDKGRRPRLNDLADSGQIERDADTVLLLHRARLDDPAAAELSVAKQRDGDVGMRPLRFKGEHCRFYEEARVDEADAPTNSPDEKWTDNL